jgi:hypothetical protein
MTQPNHLTSIDQVIAHLGPRSLDFAKISGVSPPVVSIWRKRGYIGPAHFEHHRTLLAQQGATASPDLWGMKPAPAKQEPAQ